MTIPLPPPVRACLCALRAHGHEAHIVGGCVRDRLLRREPGDWDVCTSALPGEVKEALTDTRIIETGLQHGTVTALIDGMPIEITTYRVDGDYLDHRRPASVSFTRSLEEDLRRRDFTVNAMAYSPDTGLIDPFGGREDLDKQLLRCVGDPDARFTEDALRILRLVRFAAQLGFTPEPATLQAGGELNALLRHCSAERIAAELGKLLTGSAAEQALCIAADSGILAQALPEFAPCIGFSQRSPYHDRTVDRHIFAVVGAAPRDPVVRWAALLHDIGKPATFTTGPDGTGHFYGHEKESARIAREALIRLRLPAKTIEQVSELVHAHMRPLRPDKVKLRKLVGRHGADFVRRLIDLKIADNRGHAAGHDDLVAMLEEVRRALEELLLEPPCFTTADLAVDGGDLIALGMRPGPEIGAVLRMLLDLAQRDPAANTREHLLQAAQDYLQAEPPPS